MVFGTFDNLHPGHLSYFSQARSFGEELVVVVARDKNVLKIKGKTAAEDEQQRLRSVKKALKSSGIEGKAVLGSMADSYAVVRKYRPEVIALGYDQTVKLKELKSEIERSRLFCKIVRLKPYRPDKYKSSLIRK